MYIEKDFLIDKINEFCKHRNIEMSYDEKDMLATSVSRVLDKERLLTFEEFVELLDHNAEIEQYKNIEFDDEIISIEECGYIDMIDFDVSGNKLFFADGILTHNSATNNIDEALFLGDRIILMEGKLPGTIKEEFMVDMPRPREHTDMELLHMREVITDRTELVL